MVSRSKKMRFVSENDSSTSEDSCSDSTEYNLADQKSTTTRKPTRTPKCFSRNALMARENRLKKKLYMETLENGTNKLQTENKKLNTIVENQSSLIAELKKEVKYLKSVLSNSKDISNLISNIRSSTGMSVSSSLILSDKSLKHNHFHKSQAPISRKVAHPWEEMDLETDNIVSDFASYPTPESSSIFPSPDHDYLNDILLSTDIDFNEKLFENELFDEPTQKIDDASNVILEHNYTTQHLEENDVGVCLHVSKHKVSLEFCSSCSENATESRTTEN